MIVVQNLTEVDSVDDLEIAPGVYFRYDTWRIETGPGEHMTMRFNDLLDSVSGQISLFPDLKRFLKILTYYSFPSCAANELRSWRSTEAAFKTLRSFAIEFLFEKSFVTKNLIQNIDGEQIKDFLNICALSSDYSPKFRRLVLMLPRLLSTWISVSEMKAMPAWCCTNFTMTEVLSARFKSKKKELSDEDRQGAWQPLNAHQIKMGFDTASDYIYLFSDSICAASYLVNTRPRKQDGMLCEVRQDGRTKELFKKFQNFKAPTWPGTDNRILEFKAKTQQVRSLGYKSGYQSRTTIDIDAVRPELINLKRACIFVIGLLTGMRRAEIAHLKVGALFVRDGMDYLHITRFKTASNSKKGTPDDIPVPGIVAKAVSVLEELLRWQRNELGSDYLLVTDIITRKRFPKIKIATVGKDIRAFLTEFTGEAGHPHQLRKTIAWLLISKGEENIDLIRQLFGHKSYGMTLRYVLRNDLLSGSVMELLEENYTEDLHNALSKIASGEAAGDLAEAVRQRSAHHYPGQLLATEVELFVHAALESGVPLFISKIPIGGFCISSSDFSKVKPPCISGTEDDKPAPEFCDYLNCPHVLHTSESVENVKQQVLFYETKLKHVPEDGDDRVEEYYTTKIEKNRSLLRTLQKRPEVQVIATDAVND